MKRAEDWMSDHDRDERATTLTRDRRRSGRMDVDPSLIPLLRGETVEAGSAPVSFSESVVLAAPVEDASATKRLAGFDSLDAVRGITLSLGLSAVLWLVAACIYWLI